MCQRSQNSRHVSRGDRAVEKFRESPPEAISPRHDGDIAVGA